MPSSIRNASTTVIGRDREALMRFMRIDAKAGELLREFWKVVEPTLPTILEGFYQHVTQEPQLARMIGNDIPRLKVAQKSHWARLFNGSFDDDYMQSVRAVGLIHYKIGLEPHWYVGGYNYVLSQLVVVAIRKYRWKPSQLSAVLTALNSAVILDMDIAISVYQEAMLTDRQKQQDKVTAAIQEFDDQIKVVLETVTHSAANLQNAANVLAANAEESTCQSTAVAVASEQAASNVHAVATAVEVLASSAAEIGLQAADSTSVAGKAVEQANRSSSTMHRLAEAAHKIGDIVNLITSIAAQTNLLALNATIEAARAGEAGRGFAVVAMEVKALAAQTAEATEKISEHILSIRTTTQEAVAANQEIGAVIGSVNDIATTISAAVEKQGLVTAEIARNVQMATRGTQQVSHNIAAVNQAANMTGRTAVHVLSAANELLQESERLRIQVEGFFAKILPRRQRPASIADQRKIDLTVPSSSGGRRSGT